MFDPETAIALAPVRQFCVFLANRPGTLLALVKLLRDYHVEVLGLSTQDSSDMTSVRMVVSDPETVETIFMEKGIPHDTRELVVVELAEIAGGLTGCLETLRESGINVFFSYPLLCRPGDHALLAFALDKQDAGAEALMQSGYRLLAQNDLSR